LHCGGIACLYMRLAQVLLLLAPRMDPAATRSSSTADKRMQLLATARSMLAGLQSEVDELVEELGGSCRGPKVRA
jgi:hypothetical protein